MERRQGRGGRAWCVWGERKMRKVLVEKKKEWWKEERAMRGRGGNENLAGGRAEEGIKGAGEKRARRGPR